MQLEFFAANRMAILVVAAVCSVLVTTVAIVLGSTPELEKDILGVQKIYPTREGGYEWYLDATDPRAGLVISPIATPLLEADDGAWRINTETSQENDGVRMYVPSPVMWRDVEMTGYVMLHSYSFDEEFAWAARSGKHSPDDVCDATAYFGAFGFSGDSWFQKKVFHGEGYTDRRHSGMSIEPLQGRWIGLKLVAYNINPDNSVKLELWVDNKADNNWVKLAETVDSGGWHHDFPGMCAKPGDHIITEPRPRAMFRVDNANFDFKKLSVREINGPQS